MLVPFRLRRRPTPAPAAALWLASADPRHLAGLCARLGAWPEVYALAGGFLVVTDDPPPTGLPRAGPLRRLAGNLYLPADADLVPALHPAEAADLTRSRGLVVLPAGVLAFDPARPLAVSAAVAPAAVRRETWELFPPRPPRADRLIAVEFDGPTQPDAILEQGRPGATQGDRRDAGPTGGSGIDGGGTSVPPVTEAPRPPDAPAVARAAGAVAAGLGQFLAWLGRVLRRPGLAKAGARLLRRAVERVPRLTEKILGKQEAALREILRRFRAGDIEGALRHAPTAVNDGGRPGRVDASWTLGTRDPRYSLSALLGGGPASIWLGGGDVWAELRAEYHRIAREAADRGDHRRAAYVYGVLLQNLRLAADTLAAGGLHRDAAVLYRDRLHDPRAAAVAFERAGDFDEAVRLYRQTEQFERAGDLLRRLGDEDGAVELYVAAADRLAKSCAWLAAGELLRSRAGRVDLALAYYRSGWEAPPPAAIACGERLLEHYLGTDDWPAVGDLLDEAAVRLAPPARPADAGRFYAAVVRAADRPLPEGVAADLRDRARLALAVHLRTPGGPRAAAAVSELFGRVGVWPAPIVRDAAFAAGHRPRPAVAEPPSVAPAVRLLAGPVTAVTIARGSSDVVVGSATGEVVVWRAVSGQVEPVTNQGGSVDALAADYRGRVVVALHRDGDDARLRSYYRDHHDRFQYAAERHLHGTADDPARLLPVVRGYYGDCYTNAIDAGDLVHFRGVRLVPAAAAAQARLGDRADTAIVPVRVGVWVWSGRVIALARGEPPRQGDLVFVLSWQPAVPAGSPLRVPPVDWLTDEPDVIELAGLTSDGEVYWSRVKVVPGESGRDTVAAETACLTASNGGNYRAAALVGPGRVVAVTASNDVVWSRVGGRVEPSAPPQRLPVPARAVAILARPAADDVAVVFEDGTAVRLPAPH